MTQTPTQEAEAFWYETPGDEPDEGCTPCRPQRGHWYVPRLESGNDARYLAMSAGDA